MTDPALRYPGTVPSTGGTAVTTILIVKTGALGDVLRTTSILPGLRERYTDCRVTWITAPAAVDLVRSNPLVAEVVALDVKSAHAVDELQARLSRTAWDRVLSFDDEEPLCRLVSALPTKRLSGAYLESDGRRAYTPDVGPWFDMGLLSVHGKQVADRMKVDNRRSHPEILTSMLGLPMGKPELEFEPRHADFARAFFERHAPAAGGPLVGLNTGAGGRWRSKMLTPECTADVAERVSRALGGRVTFVLFGGADERERNTRIAGLLRERVRVADAGVDNALLEFAALVARCDLLVTSDSLALHVALARNVRCVAFFAPTSAAEIEMYGLGEKVVSTAPDYCSYKPDADTSSLTPERVADAVLRQLAHVSR